MEGILRPCFRNGEEISWKGWFGGGGAVGGDEYKCHVPLVKLWELSGKLKTCLQILPIPVYITLQGDISS